MVFPNPIDINVNAVDKDLVRISNDNYGSHYRLVDAANSQRFDLKIRHSAEKPNASGIVFDRHNIDIVWTKFSADPDIDDEVIQAFCVIRNASRNVGTDAVYLGTALADLMKEAGVIADLVGWQN